MWEADSAGWQQSRAILLCFFHEESGQAIAMFLPKDCWIFQTLMPW